MQKRPKLQMFLSFLLILAISQSPVIRRTMAAAPQRPGGGTGDIHKSDPCTHLPDPSGNANGIDKQCPPLGTSSGVTKGDFNGDGFADLAIGEPGATIQGQPNAGDVFVIYGSATGLAPNGGVEADGVTHIPATQLWAPGGLLSLPPEAGDLFGTALASGDFNGDGFSDLAIGIPGRNVPTTDANFRGDGIVVNGTNHFQAGAVLVIYGSKGGLNQNKTQFFELADFYVFGGDQVPVNRVSLSLAHFGQSLAWGDFNGDSVGDLAVGAPDAMVLEPDGTTGLQSSAGVVFVIAGQKNGTLQVSSVPTPAFPIPAMLLTELNKVDEFSNSGRAGDRFGLSLAAGNFTGGAVSGLAVGSVSTVNAVAGAGAVAVFNTPLLVESNFQNFNEDGLALGASTNDQFGIALATGDFNGDGFADLAVGAPFKTVVVTRSGSSVSLANAGEVVVIYGGSVTGTAPPPGPQRFNQENVLGPGHAAAGNRFGAPLTAWNFGRDEVGTFCKPPSLGGGCFNFAIHAADLAVGIPFQTVLDLGGTFVSGAGAVNVMYGSFYSNGLHAINGGGLGNVAFDAQILGFGPLAGAHFGAGLY